MSELIQITRTGPLPVSKTPGPHYETELAKALRQAFTKKSPNEVASELNVGGVGSRLLERYAYGHVCAMRHTAATIVKLVDTKFNAPNSKDLKEDPTSWTD